MQDSCLFKRKLHGEVESVETESAEFVDLEQLDDELEVPIKKYEA